MNERSLSAWIKNSPFARNDRQKSPRDGGCLIALEIIAVLEGRHDLIDPPGGHSRGNRPRKSWISDQVKPDDISDEAHVS